MTTMTPEEYLEKRVTPTRAYYKGKAGTTKKFHLGSRVIIIVFSALITVLASISFDYKDIVIASLSSLVVIVTSISELMKFKDQWSEYRTTSERIKSERAFFETGTDPYNDPADAFPKFVKNFESIVQTENQKWRAYSSDTNKILG